MTVIKICGMTNKADALQAARLGADMLGFIFYGKSPRYVNAAAAADIINELPAAVKKVGVFVDEDPSVVRAIARDTGLDTLQFHGDETPDYCGAFRGDYTVIKAFRIKGAESLAVVNDYDVDYYLLDSFASGSAGGTGKAFDWKVAKEFEFLKPVILSGGLTPENVRSAIALIAPYGVDVSTGVEISPGRKDHERMKMFIEEVRKA